MRSCGKSFAHCKSQKMAIFFKYPLPFRGAVATFLPRKGTDNFLRIKWVDCNVSSRSSSPFPAQSSNTVFTEYIHQAPVPLHRVCPLPGILNPDLQSTITCQIPTYSSDPSQRSPLLSDPPPPPSRISCFLSLGRKELMDTKFAINQASATPAHSLRDLSN